MNLFCCFLLYSLTFPYTCIALDAAHRTLLYYVWNFKWNRWNRWNIWNGWIFCKSGSKRQWTSLPEKFQEISTLHHDVSVHSIVTFQSVFLNLSDKHFPQDHKFRKSFNRRIVKNSYSCIPNIKSAINSCNRKILHLPVNNQIRLSFTCKMTSHIKKILLQKTIKRKFIAAFWKQNLK